MKLNMGVNVPDQNGYNNIGFKTNLDMYVEDSQCTEIMATNILNYVPVDTLDAFLDHLVSKMRHGGKLIIGGHDLQELVKSVMRLDFRMEEFNEILHGTRSSRQLESHYDVRFISDKLVNRGLRILKKRLVTYDYVIEAVRV